MSNKAEDEQWMRLFYIFCSANESGRQQSEIVHSRPVTAAFVVVALNDVANVRKL